MQEELAAPRKGMCSLRVTLPQHSIDASITTKAKAILTSDGPLPKATHTGDWEILRGRAASAPEPTNDDGFMYELDTNNRNIAGNENKCPAVTRHILQELPCLLLILTKCSIWLGELRVLDILRQLRASPA